VLVWDGGAQVSVDGARVAHELWAALLAVKSALPPPAPPEPATIPDAYVKAQAALDALVAAIGVDQQAAYHAGRVRVCAGAVRRCLRRRKAPGCTTHALHQHPRTNQDAARILPGRLLPVGWVSGNVGLTAPVSQVGLLPPVAVARGLAIWQSMPPE
jgi:hypothetical protein